MSQYIWTCKYCNRPLKMNRQCVYLDDNDNDKCSARQDGKTEHDSITYKLTILNRDFNFGHKPSYDKALEQFNANKNAFEHCVHMANRYSEKIKQYIARGNNLDDDRGKELEASYNRWDKMLEQAMKGKGSDLFYKMNNMKPIE